MRKLALGLLLITAVLVVVPLLSEAVLSKAAGTPAPLAPSDRGWTGFFVLLFVQVFAGLVGGFTGFLLRASQTMDRRSGEVPWPRWNDFILGIVATIIVRPTVDVLAYLQGSKTRLMDQLVGGEMSFTLWMSFLGCCVISAATLPNFILAAKHRFFPEDPG